MKLLIVDDEELTRSGLFSSIDWSSLGIRTVLQADDGFNGLVLAKKEKPDIILCDVRMPRLTGIQMLEQLEPLLPETVFIFMSGYSDKEYLKAAIRLKAVSYIEKPLDLQEVRETVLEARERCLSRRKSRKNETIQSLETASRLVRQLTLPDGFEQAATEELIRELSLPFSPSTRFTAVVIRADLKDDNASLLPSVEELSLSIRNALRHYHMDCIYMEKRVQYIVYLIFSDGDSTPTARHTIREVFRKQYAVYPKFYIAAGEPVIGMAKVFRSYTSAVILLQNSYFFPTGSFLSIADSPFPETIKEPLPDNPEGNFLTLLTAKKETEALAFLDLLNRHYDQNPSSLPNEARDLYYKLFRCLEDAARQLKLTVWSSHENILDTIEKAFSFAELHQKLLEHTRRFFTDIHNTVQENSTIFLIKDYISRNYGNENLSVKEISSHVFLSTSYICTFFKNETGQTLNQYLTEYRMEQAKRLLSDPRYKITEISSRVGYSDGNYFGKSFKKYTGLSPSEFREKMS